MESTGAAPAAGVLRPRTIIRKHSGIHTLKKKISLALDFAGSGFTNKYCFWVQHQPLAPVWLNVDGPL